MNRSLSLSISLAALVFVIGIDALLLSGSVLASDYKYKPPPPPPPVRTYSPPPARTYSPPARTYSAPARSYNPPSPAQVQRQERDGAAPPRLPHPGRPPRSAEPGRPGAAEEGSAAEGQQPQLGQLASARGKTRVALRRRSWCRGTNAKRTIACSSVFGLGSCAEGGTTAAPCSATLTAV